MPTDQAVTVDTESARAAYRAVLEGYAARPGTDLDDRCEQLTGHLRALAGDLLGLAPRMRGAYRDIAVRLMAMTHRLLDDSPGAGDDALVWYVYDAASLVRSMLTLRESPGPLGDPADADGVERAVHGKVCAACMEPIHPGEGVEELHLATLSAGSEPAYRHTDSCPVVAARRREALQVVPQDPPAL
ncbi:hypothetical protein [Streptomyces sp. AGS-58]|uniref:hypothetical protein n=1 Tax=unclassified Streptomyces TaxID=2593676 RepID=UPI0035A28E69